MTSFYDRERAFEAHEAILRQDDFLARARRYKRLGLAIVAYVGVRGVEAERFAEALADACVEQSDDREICRKISAELIRHRCYLLPEEILKALVAEHDLNHVRPAHRESNRRYGLESALAWLFATPGNDRQAEIPNMNFKGGRRA